jgi:hypothetical protein
MVAVDRIRDEALDDDFSLGNTALATVLFDDDRAIEFRFKKAAQVF